MSNKFTLDNLRAELDRKFKPLELELDGETVTLQNLMRVDEKLRGEVMEALKEIEAAQGKEDGAEQSPEDIAKLSEAVTLILRNVTANGRGDALVTALEGDLLLSMDILEKWTVATQAPEARNSPA